MNMTSKMVKVLGFIIALGMPCYVSANVSDLLHAIAIVETNNNGKLIGTHNERSRYQITRGVWEKYTSYPFELASSDTEEVRIISLMVAKKHVEWIQKQLKANGYNPTNPTYIAVVWNAGWSRFKASDVELHSVKYANYVVNIYHKIN